MSSPSSVGVLFVCWKLGLAHGTIPRGGLKDGGNFAQLGQMVLGDYPALCVRTDLMRTNLGSLLHGGRFVHANQAPPPTVKEIKLGTARPGTLYAFTLAVKDPAQVQGSDAVLATVKDAQGVIDSKWLHTADLDFYLTLRPRSAGPVTVSLSSTSTGAGDQRFAAQDPRSSSAADRRRPYPGSHRRGAQRHLANRPALRVRPDHLWQRRRTPLRALAQRRRLRGHGQRLPMVQVHL